MGPNYSTLGHINPIKGEQAEKEEADQEEVLLEEEQVNQEEDRVYRKKCLIRG